jgi:hypothetical protein
MPATPPRPGTQDHGVPLTSPLAHRHRDAGFDFLLNIRPKNGRANYGISNEVNSNEPVPPTKFSASEWHDKLSTDDIFRPSESLRKSPSKSTRTPAKPITRGRGSSRADHDGHTSNEASTESVRDTESKAAAFQPGKLSDDWVANLRTSKTNPQPPTFPDTEEVHPAESRQPYVVVEEDVMDVDDEPANPNANRRATTNGVHRSTVTGVRKTSRPSSTSGVDLSDIAQQAPFTPKATGLKGMDDLAANLPFESRAESVVDPERKVSTRIRPLELPRPPKVVVPPAEDRLTAENWAQYARNVATYMQDWNSFNAKMIEHFRRRQDQVCGNMLQNWITIRSDGPDAHEGSQDGVAKQGGYATYMQWLKEDEKCREWWNHANEQHLQCLEDLGRMREKAKRSLR